MLRVTAAGARELFERLAHESANYSIEDVATASANLLVNALRQAYPRREQAADRWDELSANMKTLLMQHYDSFGRLKGVFPYTQSIEMPLFDARPRKK